MVIYISSNNLVYLSTFSKRSALYVFAISTHFQIPLTLKHYMLKTNFNHIAHPYNCIIFITGLMVPGHELMTRIQTELERIKKYEIRKRTTVTREIMNNQTTLVYRKTKL